VNAIRFAIDNHHFLTGKSIRLSTKLFLVILFMI